MVRKETLVLGYGCLGMKRPSCLDAQTTQTRTRTNPRALAPEQGLLFPPQARGQLWLHIFPKVLQAAAGSSLCEGGEMGSALAEPAPLCAHPGYGSGNDLECVPLGRVGNTAALLSPGLAAEREGMDLSSLCVTSPMAHPRLEQPPCVLYLVLRWGTVELLCLPFPIAPACHSFCHLLLWLASWLSLGRVVAAGLPVVSSLHWGSSNEELLCCFLQTSA